MKRYLKLITSSFVVVSLLLYYIRWILPFLVSAESDFLVLVGWSSLLVVLIFSLMYLKWFILDINKRE
jgi:hypothetical protein